MNPDLLPVIGVGILVAVAGGLLGSFALLRRMALVGDALSHVALPGIALGLLWHFSPFLGSLAFLLVGTTIIWAAEHKTKLPVDTLVGVLFVTALAAGTLLTPNTELLEALFGNIAQISFFDFWALAAVSVFIIGTLIALYKKLSLALISGELATSANLRPHQLELVFLTLFAVLVALGIKFTGVLLIGALVIIPSAIARNFAGSMKMYMVLSALIGAAGAMGGILIASWYGVAPGPVFVLLLSPLFFISVFLRK